MRVYMSIAVRYNSHLVLYRYCCKGRYSVNIHLKCQGKVGEFDYDWRVVTLYYVRVVTLYYVLRAEWSPCTT